MRFDNLISRADESILQNLIGQGPLRLMSLLDSHFSSPTQQRELLLALRKPQELLLDPHSRKLLLELLRPNEANSLSAALGGGKDDPYRFLATLPYTRHAQRTVLFSFFELSELEKDKEEPLRTTQTAPAIYSLFPHQRNAAREVSSILAIDPFRAILHMPTGSGKTRTAMHIIAQHLAARAETVVIWLAHSEELCEQAAAEFLRAWEHLGNRDVTLMRYWGSEEADLGTIHDGIVVAGLQKTVQVARRSISAIGRLGARASLVVMDEAHQAVAPTYQLILEALVDPHPQTKLLGLTATPGRSWADIDADERLAEFFRRRKVTLKVPGYGNPVDYLIDRGYLAQVSFRPLFHNPGFGLSEADLSAIETNLELPASVLRRLAADEQRNLLVLSEVEQLVRSHQRIILFAISVEHSDMLAAVLQARGVRANSVTSRTPPSERRRLLEEFKSNSDMPRVLCNFGVLTTGFDAPRTSAAVIARPTTSLVLFSQMVGRAIRGPNAGGNSNAEIVTVVDQGLPGFGAVGEAFFNWEDVWEVRSS
jgi:DNA repair protein RadD